MSATLPLRTRIGIVLWILSAGLAFVFIDFGIEKFVLPAAWIGWVPGWLDGFFGMESTLWLKIIGSVEIFTGLLLLVPSRMWRRIAITIMILQLLGVLSVVMQSGWDTVFVRDIGLLFTAVALWMLLGDTSADKPVVQMGV